MDEKKIETIRKIAENLLSDNKKSVNGAKKGLTKHAHKNPDEFVAAGLKLEDYPRFRNEVMKYGCIGRVIPVGGVANDPEIEMRSAHEFYNMLNDACRPLLKAYRSLIEGPVQREAKHLNKQISVCYEDITKITQDANHKRIKGKNPDAMKESQPEIDEIRKKIVELKKQRDALTKDAFSEIKELRKEHKADLKEIKNAINKDLKDGKTVLRRGIINAVRDTRPNDFWFGNYNRVTEEFKQSLDMAMESPFYLERDMHYRYERRDGSRPGDICALPSWNGQGALTASLSEKKIQKSIRTVLNGTNMRFRLRKLTQGDLERFGLKSTFMDDKDFKGNPKTSPETMTDNLSKKSERLYIASIRNSLGWYEVPVILHRPLVENLNDDALLDDEVREVSYIRRKVGLNHTGDLYVTLKRLTNKNRAEKGVAHITPTWEKLANGDTKYCEWKIGNESGYEILPASILKGLNQSVRLMKYISSHVSFARTALAVMSETGNPSDLLPGDLEGNTRSQMRHAYRSWCYLICPDSSPVEEVDSFKNTLAKMRTFARVKHGKFKLPNGEEDSGSYGGNYDLMIASLAEIAEDELGLKDNDAIAFSILLAFDERFSHLYPWSVNIKNKKLRQRTDVYRNFASRIGSRVSIFKFPKTDYRTRHMSEEQKVVSPSELTKWLKNYADREGLQVIEEARPKDASASVVTETLDTARNSKINELPTSDGSPVVTIKRKRRTPRKDQPNSLISNSL